MDMAQYYEIVLYSPSLDGVADPVVMSLDKHGCIMHRLYRDATYYTNGVHVKDLSRLNRNIVSIHVVESLVMSQTTTLTAVLHSAYRY